MANTYDLSTPVSSKSYLPMFLPKPPHRIIQSSEWRSPKLLGGDFLGLSQAVKAVASTQNQYLKRIKTADSSNLNVARNSSDFLNSDGGHCSRMSQHLTSSIHDCGVDDRNVSVTRPPSFANHSRKGKAVASFNSKIWFMDPVQLFQMFSKLVANQHEPDVKLHCLGEVWHLHRAYMLKSEVLSQLLHSALSTQKVQVYRDAAAEKIDNFVASQDVYSGNYKEVTHRLTSEEIEKQRQEKGKKPVSSQSAINLTLRIADPCVTKHAFAIALGHLYLEESIVSSADVVCTLAAACSLQFEGLIASCCRVMICSLSSATVCEYLHAADRYRQQPIQLACERWLELNLVPQLAYTLYIRDLSVETLNKILQSSRLFTFNEFSLYKALCIWLFMKLHPDIQFLPPLTAIMTYFSSMSRTCSFLEREDGVEYSSTFNCLRLHGITDTNHIQDIMYMNVIPQSWLLRVLSHHYHALQGGGDMSYLLNFSIGASRYGFILRQEPGYHSEIISLHGFHFEAKAQRHGLANSYIVYLQRLRPTDPALSMRVCNRSTFSIRRDRIVRYQLSVQYTFAKDGLQWKHCSTGILEQCLGLDHKTSKSEVLQVTDACPPFYVSIAIFFPTS